MDCRTRRREALHGPWPSPIEELQALYADEWEIYRDLLLGGKHGDWIAKRLRPRDHSTSLLRAPSVDALARKLEAESERERDA
jgi:hypothetical protein